MAQSACASSAWCFSTCWSWATLEVILLAPPLSPLVVALTTEEAEADDAAEIVLAREEALLRVTIVLLWLWAVAVLGVAL